MSHVEIITVLGNTLFRLSVYWRNFGKREKTKLRLDISSTFSPKLSLTGQLIMSSEDVNLSTDFTEMSNVSFNTPVRQALANPDDSFIFHRNVNPI